jgi:hypothetical protein
LYRYTLGGTSPEKAKYSYDVPSNWVEEAPNKVEKGAGGQDSRWVLGGSRGAVKCFCLTLNRAGEDGAAFDLTAGGGVVTAVITVARSRAARRDTGAGGKPPSLS